MSELVWSFPRRLAFRFALLAGALFVYPFPFGFLPHTHAIADALSAPLTALVNACSTLLLGEPPVDQATGSGDTLFAWMSALVCVLLAALGAAIWTVLDERRTPRRTAYPRLAAAALVALRHVLAAAMLSYAFAKIINTQFPAPGPVRLDTRVGELSPMGLLWTFMGHSTAYSLFGGLLEALGGVLLLWRRTAVLGALVVMGVMANVVMLNFSYDVPVKLYSTQLLVMAFVVALPQLRRVLVAVLGGAVPAVPRRSRGADRVERARLAAKLAFVAVLAYAMVEQVRGGLAYRGRTHELVGTWTVERFALDGTEVPPLGTDAVRWRRLLVDNHRAVARAMNEARRTFLLAIDERGDTVVATTGKVEDRWHYRLAAARLVLEGTLDGKPLRVELVREPEPPLVTRGFHWVQEHPFNR